MAQDNKLRFLVIGNAMVVLLIGLVSGLMLIFSLLDAVTLWPLPEWKVAIPGSARGWQAAHVGGILNGVMIAGAAYLIQALDLTGRREKWAAWGMIITGWANTVFYWAGNFADNRGLSVSATPFGEGDMAGAIAFLGGGAGMVFTFIAVTIFALAAFEKAKAS